MDLWSSAASVSKARLGGGEGWIVFIIVQF